MAAEPRPLAQLLAAASAGDESAWSAIVDRFHPLVWSVSRAYGLDTRDASDVSQTVWLRLVENLNRIREPEALPGWLRTTTRNECLRHSRRRTHESPVDWQLLQGLPDDTGADDKTLADERTTVVSDALSRLSDKCRALLRVFAFSPDTGYTEIGATLGMPVGSIGPTRARCLGYLRRGLESVGYLKDQEPAR